MNAIALILEGVQYQCTVKMTPTWAFPVGTRAYPPQRWYAAAVHDPAGNLNDGYRHTGIDLNLDTAPWGDVERGMPVYALAHGTVHFATNDWNGVGMVVLQHEHAGCALYTRYAHLNLLEKDTFAAGDVIGTIADWCTGDHLHLDMALAPFTRQWLDDSIHWIDPVPVLKAHLDPHLVDLMLQKGEPWR